MAKLSSATQWSTLAAITTADIRRLGAELNGWFVSVGLVQTADTGQVNWATVNLPGAAATIIGYEIWHSVDSSFFFKFEWFTGISAATTNPAFALTVGTGSDGAGNITGVFYPRVVIINTNAANSPTVCQTYICHTNDFLGVCYKIGGSNTYGSIVSFAIEKMVNNVGAPSGDGWIVSHVVGSASGVLFKKSIRIASPAFTGLDSSSHTVVAGNITSSDDGAGNKLVWPQQHINQQQAFSNYLCSTIVAEYGQGTTFQAILVGTTLHTYIGIGNAMGTGNSGFASTNYGVAMLWE